MRFSGWLGSASDPGSGVFTYNWKQTIGSLGDLAKIIRMDGEVRTTGGGTKAIPFGVTFDTAIGGLYDPATYNVDIFISSSVSGKLGAC